MAGYRYYRAEYIAQHFYATNYCPACRWRMAYEAVHMCNANFHRSYPGLVVAAYKLIDNPQPEHEGQPCNRMPTEEEWSRRR